MSGSRIAVGRLLALCEAEGVRVLLNAAGDGVRLEAAGPPSAELVRLARAHRAALLEALAPAKVEDVPRIERPARSSFAADLTLTPGHCGSCARWEVLPAPLAHLGECSAGRRAHGWHDGNSVAAVEIHAAHSCAAWEGKGYRARASGKRYSPAPAVGL